MVWACSSTFLLTLLSVSCLHLLSPFLCSSLCSRHCKAQNTIIAIPEVLLHYYNRNCEKKILDFLLEYSAGFELRKLWMYFNMLHKFLRKINMAAQQNGSKEKTGQNILPESASNLLLQDSHLYRPEATTTMKESYTCTKNTKLKINTTLGGPFFKAMIKRTLFKHCDS